jgi:hypothetical protein
MTISYFEILTGSLAAALFLEGIMIVEQGATLALPAPGLQPPVGLAGIVREFGDIGLYLRADGCLDPRWEAVQLMPVVLPFGLVLAWDHSRTVSSFRCHRRLTQIFADIFERIVAAGLAAKVRSFGGCFMYRPQRTGAKLSTHSWGIAIDLNPETNQLGTVGDMDAEVVKLFRDAGFEWGGTWVGRGCDPMHFQFCRSY